MFGFESPLCILQIFPLLQLGSLCGNVWFLLWYFGNWWRVYAVLLGRKKKTETMNHLSEESASLLQAGHTHWKQIIRAGGLRESKSQEATVKPTRVLWPFAWAWLSSFNTVWGFSHIWKATWLLSSQRLTEELSLGLDSRNLFVLRPMPCFWPRGLLGWLSSVPQALLIEKLFISHSL